MVGLGVAVEVELAGKARPRLDAILGLHASWIMSGKSGGVIYISGDEEGQRRVQRSAERVGSFGRKLRLELLDTMKAQAYAGYEAAKSERVTKASAAPRPILAVDGR